MELDGSRSVVGSVAGRRLRNPGSAPLKDSISCHDFLRSLDPLPLTPEWVRDISRAPRAFHCAVLRACFRSCVHACVRAPPKLALLQPVPIAHSARDPVRKICALPAEYEARRQIPKDASGTQLPSGDENPYGSSRLRARNTTMYRCCCCCCC